MELHSSRWTLHQVIKFSFFNDNTSAGGGGGGGCQGSPNPANGDGGSGGGARDSNSVGGTGNTPPVSPPQGKDGVEVQHAGPNNWSRWWWRAIAEGGGGPQDGPGGGNGGNGVSSSINWISSCKIFLVVAVVDQYLAIHQVVDQVEVEVVDLMIPGVGTAGTANTGGGSGGGKQLHQLLMLEMLAVQV